MDTRPGHAQVTEPQSLCDKSILDEPDTRCPRQSRSLARRDGVKDVSRGEEARLGLVQRIAEER